VSFILVVVAVEHAIRTKELCGQIPDRPFQVVGAGFVGAPRCVAPKSPESSKRSPMVEPRTIMIACDLTVDRPVPSLELNHHGSGVFVVGTTRLSIGRPSTKGLSSSPRRRENSHYCLATVCPNTLQIELTLFIPHAGPRRTVPRAEQTSGGSPVARGTAPPEISAGHRPEEQGGARPHRGFAFASAGKRP